jgi:acetoin utilization deacetylase AcuC-like enzyme
MNVVSHAALAELHPTAHHPETPRRLEVVLAALDAWTDAVPATDEQVERCHTAEHVARIRAVDEETWLDGDTPASATSYEAALLAAGGAIQAAATGAFAVVRPPGHHALAERAMGFCLFNNVAVAARAAQAEQGLERVAIVDWDVHHGNGTQAIFWDDAAVLYVSLHQYGYGFFPGTGGAGERGGDGAPGATLNLPLPAGTGEPANLEVFHEAALPAVRDFRPVVLLVSAGFDAHAADPLGSLGLSEAAFVRMRDSLLELGMPQAYVLEGGYDLGALERSVAALLGGASA